MNTASIFPSLDKTILRMQITLLVLLSFVLLLSGVCANAGQDQDVATIDTFIARQAQREHGEEYREARTVRVGDLNHDGLPDTAVLYTIEGQQGSNNYIQYLAVFTRTKTHLAIHAYTAVGGKGHRSVELTAVTNNQINLATLDYTPSDASCCPSKKGATHFVLVGKRLREQKRS